MKILILVLALATGAAAQDTSEQFYWWSTAAMVGAHTADVVTTRHAVANGAVEANPFYGDQFTGRDIAVKYAMVGGTVAFQRFLIHRYPNSKLTKLFGNINFTIAAGYGGIAARNYCVGR